MIQFLRFIILIFILLYRSTEREIPLPEEETVQFNQNDVVLDFCKENKIFICSYKYSLIFRYIGFES